MYNDGPFPIRVERVAPPAGSGIVHTYVDTYAKYGFVGAAIFRPLIVVGHWNQTIVVHLKRHCVTGAPGEVVTTNTLPVTFSFFGYYHTVSIAIQPLALRLRRSCQ